MIRTFAPARAMLRKEALFSCLTDEQITGLLKEAEFNHFGRGEAVIRAELDYARAEWQPVTFRLFVTAWNARAIRVYERLGFREVGRETRSFPLHGENEFLRMERPS